MTATPENWTWAGPPLEPGPAVLVDVDGVISDGSHRQHFLERPRKDWDGFFAEAGSDLPVEGSVELLASIDTSLAVVLLTARPSSLRRTTIDWLGAHGYRWEVLVLRGTRDRWLRSPEFKRRSVHELRSAGFEPRLAIDDDRRNIEMFRDEGVPTLYVHSGYYEA